MDWVSLDLAIILLCLVASAFFSSSETALTAVSRARLFALQKEGRKRAGLVLQIREKKDMLIGTILVGNNLVNFAAASISTVFFIHIAGEELGPIYATVVLTLVVLVFSEVLPKTVAIHHSETLALAVSPLIRICIIVFKPITWTIQRLVWGILRIFGVDLATAKSLTSAAESIRGMIEMHHSEGEVEKEDKDMLGSILDLSAREISEVMIHRKQVISIDSAQEPDDIINQAIECGHSRIPLWRGESDNIIGVLHVKDLLKLLREQKIGVTREMIRRTAQRPWFVPETTSLSDQLLAFREQRKHFACVVDEYGAWQGIVTLEDIIEEIVGDIDDEHDPLEIDDIIPLGNDAVRVEGTVTIRDLNRHQSWDLPDEEATTIAGLVLHEARVIPENGAAFEFYGYRFVVEERTNSQITQLQVQKLPALDA
jgi:Mg2+/Co2+ transporter CorB